MCRDFVSFVLFFLVLMPNLGLAAEGSSAAGIAGGSNMRSALLPPPGIYMWQGLLPAVNRRISSTAMATGLLFLMVLKMTRGPERSLCSMSLI